MSQHTLTPNEARALGDPDVRRGFEYYDAIQASRKNASPSRRGAELLDVKFPLWFEHINVGSLDMSGARMCILGQLYGSSEAGCNALGVMNYRSFRPIYGFEASSIGGYKENADVLMREWCELIDDRRANAPVFYFAEA